MRSCMRFEGHGGIKIAQQKGDGFPMEIVTKIETTSSGR